MTTSTIQSHNQEAPLGRPPEFTDEQVIAAGEEIVANGQTPTGTAIRRQLGGGRPDRLKCIWAAHSEAKAQRKARASELPEPLTKHLEKARSSFATVLEELICASYDCAVEEANARTSALRKEAERIRTEAQAELTDAYKLIEDLQKELDAAQQACRSAGQCSEQEREQRHLAEQRVAACEAANNELRSANGELKKDADDLRQKLADCMARYQQMRPKGEATRK